MERRVAARIITRDGLPRCIILLTWLYAIMRLSRAALSATLYFFSRQSAKDSVLSFAASIAIAEINVTTCIVR